MLSNSIYFGAMSYKCAFEYKERAGATKSKLIPLSGTSYCKRIPSSSETGFTETLREK